MMHFVCSGGCGGVANEEGVCKTSGCQKEGQPLKQCYCQDGQHRQALELPQDEESKESSNQ